MTKATEQNSTRLREARELRGLTQEEFAAHLGVPQQQLSRWEVGKVRPSDEIIAAIARSLRVSADYLLGLTSDANAYVSGRPLTPMQTRLLWALDEGHISIAFEALTELTKGDN